MADVYTVNGQRVTPEEFAATVVEAMKSPPADSDLRTRLEELLDRPVDGDDVVRVTISPIPGVGIGQRTSTYISQDALRRLLSS